MSFENRNTQPHLGLGGALKKFMSGDPTLRLNKLVDSLQGAVVTTNENTWVSSTRRNEHDKNKISIGTAQLPHEVAKRWGVETDDVNEQILTKFAHELAHQFQIEKGFENALVRWLVDSEGKEVIASEHIPYIELYAFIAQNGRITGLSSEPIYAEQSKNTGELKVEILEDITELISAYLISDEYFNYMLSISRKSLTHEETEFICTKVIEICRDLH